MKDGQLLRVKVIKTEADLPKETGCYQCHEKNVSPEDIIDSYYYDCEEPDDFKDVWLGGIDWYLIPDETTDSDIYWHLQNIVKDESKAYNIGYADGAKAALNNEIKHIE